MDLLRAGDVKKTAFSAIRRVRIAPGHWRHRTLILAVAATLAASCGNARNSMLLTQGTVATVRFAYLASTTPRTDLPPAADACVAGVGHNHIHPSWRNFARVDLTAVGASRWEITFTDVPVNQRLSVRVSDANVCDENPTGAATRNVFANDVLLVDIVPTPGTGTEPGLAFTVAADGRVTP